MFRQWLLPGLLALGACSRGEVGSLNLPGTGDSVAVLEEPMLVFGCEEGHVTAYLVPNTSSEAGPIDGDAVRVQLDSAPPCLGSAP